MSDNARIWDSATTVSKLFDSVDASISKFRSTLVDFLNEFARTPELCSEAFVHPLDFNVFQWVISARVTLRFHVWQIGRQSISDEIDHRHDHLWRLRSHVLCGELVEHELEIAETSSDRTTDETWELAEIIQDGIADTVIATGQLVHVASDRGIHVRTGESYDLAPGKFHWTEPLGTGMVATIVRSTAELKGPARTIVTPGSYGRPRASRTKIEIDQREAIVNSVIAAMSD